MKKFVYLFITFTLTILLLPGHPSTARAEAAQPEDNAGAVVCAPDVYMQPPADCLPLGPSEYLTQMARLGMAFPLQPLPAAIADASLKTLPYHYYKVNSDTGTGFYSSLDAAQSKQGATRIIPSGSTLYVVYSDVVDTGHGIYFQLPSGAWMPGDGSRVSLPDAAPGLEFYATPRNGFGWILEPNTPVKSQPNSLPGNLPVRTLPQYSAPNATAVQIYSIQNIEGTDWMLIGPNEWVESSKIAAVFPDNTPPQGVTNGRWIDVDLSQQTLSVYENEQLVFATVMASGAEPTWTRPGLFQIYQKKELETMSGDQGTPDYYYLENVPWTMYFDKARALHGAYWRARLGYAQSHGCVNLTVGDAHWLFNWAHDGDWVNVHDPSGETPTDPAMYGEGGA
jgi:lipoprotein-anchoring transpeptidase ErfK/SrfK